MRKRIKERKKIILEFKMAEIRNHHHSPRLPQIDLDKQHIMTRHKHFHKEPMSSLSTVKSKLSTKKFKTHSPSTLNSSQQSITSPPFNNHQKIDQHTFFSLDVTTKNWCLFDSTLNKMQGFRQTYTRQIASLTKIMTTYLAIITLANLKISNDTKVKITSTAASLIGTTAQLKQNTFISFENLFYGTMLPSGNDAAYTLAEYVGYFMVLTEKDETSDELDIPQFVDLTDVNTNCYVQEFISKMNQTALQLGLTNTRFSNPHGLQNAMNLSSAKDIAVLSSEVTKNQLFKVIMSTVYHRYDCYEDESLRKKKTKNWWNTNKLLMKDWEGVKTGQTGSAGNCLASLKQGVFIVVLNSSNSQTRFSDTEKIYNWYMGLQKTNSLQIKKSDILLPRSTKTNSRYLQTTTTEDSL